VLRSAEAAFLQQQRYVTVGLAAARRAWLLGDPKGMLPALTILQGHAARDGANSVDLMLAEQNIDAPADGSVNTDSLAGIASDGRPLGSLLEQAGTQHALELMAVTQIADAARVAVGLSIATRQQVGWTRMVNSPCCPRCAILAGKFFRWNSGFLRHPHCLCRHIPTREDVVGDVRTDPKALFDGGHVTGVTQAERKAITDGADINRVINARRGQYMDDAGHKLTRDSTTRRGTGIRVRPTPEQVYRSAGDDQAAALRSLKKFGYIL
jgi:hypothetical protein